MAAFIDMTGHRFGRLVVVNRTPATGRGAYWLCACDCGKTAEVFGHHLRKGLTQSCGCYHRERLLAAASIASRTHGMTKTATYRSYRSMLNRCHGPGDTADTAYYRDRGIKVCPQWQSSFEAFMADMGERPAGHTLDRIDPELGYSPENCRWATHKQQQNNRRTFNRFLSCEGRTKTVQQWSEETGLTHSCILKRIGMGWPVERALTTPSRRAA